MTNTSGSWAAVRGRGSLYRTICLEAPPSWVSINHLRSHELGAMADHMRPHCQKRLGGASESHCSLPHTRLRRPGADFAICPDNTYHQAFEYLLPPLRSPATYRRCGRMRAPTVVGYARLGILGDEVFNGGSCLSRALEKFGTSAKYLTRRPGRINEIISKSWSMGFFADGSRLY